MLKEAGVKLYGYVHSMSAPGSNVPRPLSEVRADVSRWFQLFPGQLAGVFVDEVVEATSGVRPQRFCLLVFGLRRPLRRSVRCSWAHPRSDAPQDLEHDARARV